MNDNFATKNKINLVFGLLAGGLIIAVVIFALQNRNLATQIEEVKAGALDPSAITYNKIDDSVYAELELKDGEVLSVNIADLAVTTNKIEDESVTGDKLAEGLITINHLGGDIVSSLNIINETITDEDVAFGANILWSKISKSGSSIAHLSVRNASDVDVADLGGYFVADDVESILAEIGVGGAGAYVLKAGDTMTGALNVIGGYVNTDEEYRLGGVTILDNPGTQSIFVGEGAGTNLLTGTNNTIMGFKAGNLMTTGVDNVIIGRYAAWLSTGSSFNVFVGRKAGEDATGGSNVYIGYNAGQNTTTGEENTFIGSNSGRNSQGTGNVYIGRQAGRDNSSGSFNVFIGHDAGVSGAGSNKLYIENKTTNTPLVYGEFDNDLFRIYGHQEIDIQTASNLGLVVKGAATQSANLQEWQDSGGTNLLNITSAGRIDFGVSNTQIYKDVSDNINIHSNMGSGKAIIIGDPNGIYTTIFRANDITFKATVNATPRLATMKGIVVKGKAGQSANLQEWQDSGGVVLSAVDSSGSLGIGTATPNEKLEIDYGNLRFNAEPTPAKATAAVNPTAGNLDGGYYYRITFVTADGETGVGNYSTQVSPANEQVDLTDIPTGTSKVTARKIYRTVANGPYVITYLVDTISDNTTTTYTDNIADGSLGAAGPWNNTTGGIGYWNSGSGLEFSTSVTRLGYQAGQVNQGYRNTFIGNGAGIVNTTGYSNVFTGAFAGYSNTTGYHNSFFGGGAGYTNSSGYNNTFMGTNAGRLNTSGLENVYLGYRAGEYRTDADKSVLIGVEAGQLASAGGSDVIIGDRAGKGASTLGHNVFIGREAGEGVTGAYNLMLGSQAGETVTSGIGNVFLGYQSGENAGTGDYNVFIGYQAGQNETNSNRLYIDNSNTTTPLIYGEFDGGLRIQSQADAKQALIVKANSATQTANLQEWQNSGGGVLAQIDAGGGAVFNETGLSTADFRIEGDTDANLLFVDAGADAVGIGTASPQSALHVPDGKYAQFEDNNAGAPAAGDCDSDTERGRISYDTSNNRVYFCGGASRGWDYLTLTD
ncbi:MAG TPA: hypothetical protein ENI23_08370 [bacterium]|nr:hypothetical protein [bacterium]